jgi:hypothetical protein
VQKRANHTGAIVDWSLKQATLRDASPTASRRLFASWLLCRHPVPLGRPFAEDISWRTPVTKSLKPGVPTTALGRPPRRRSTWSVPERRSHLLHGACNKRSRQIDCLCGDRSTPDEETREDRLQLDRIINCHSLRRTADASTAPAVSQESYDHKRLLDGQQYKTGSWDTFHPFRKFSSPGTTFWPTSETNRNSLGWGCSSRASQPTSPVTCCH